MTPSAAWDAYLDRLDEQIGRAQEQSKRLSRLRLAVVVGGAAVALAVGSWVTAAAGWGVAVLVLVVFLVLVRRHDRLEAGITRLQRWRAIKAQHRARQRLDWDALPAPPAGPPPPDHPFAVDLDLLGPRSLTHLIDTSASEGGHLRLRQWLLNPVPHLADIHERQALVRALQPLGRFRDRLTLAAWQSRDGAGDRWDSTYLLEWLEEREDLGRLRRTALGLSLLAAVNLVLFLGWAVADWPGWWGITLPAYFAVYTYWYRALKSLFDDASELERSLGSLRAVLELLETYRLPPPLATLCAPFRSPDAPPSAMLQRVTRIAAAASFQSSELLWLILNTLVPWDLICAYQLHRAKVTLHDRLPRWLDVWHDVEALCALANFGALTPAARLPEVVAPEADGPVLDAAALGHPLIAPPARVTNDIAVDALGRVALITGSNMSGKSTFLRTIGLNLVLAYAGGPVIADRLRVRPLRPFTCLNVSDSVNDGISYFYAEVRRLKALLVALEGDHPVPQLSLIDEIFRGTNNRERLIGSRAFVERLVDSPGVAFISTHDLELVELADRFESVRNLHFREEVHEGRMVFDYRLHEGPCPTTNALKIMAMEGLPVAS